MSGIYEVTDQNGNKNRILADQAFCDEHFPGKWKYLGEAEQPAPVVFPALSRKQLRYGLLSLGITSEEVEARIDAIPDDAMREAALIDWQDSREYERSHPLLLQIATEMDLTPQQVDAAWLAASRT